MRTTCICIAFVGFAACVSAPMAESVSVEDKAPAPPPLKPTAATNGGSVARQASDDGRRRIDLVGGWAEASGLGAVEAGQEAKACRSATNNALTNAIMQVAGVLVETEFSSREREFVAKRRRVYELKVAQRVNSASRGFVERFEELSRKRDARTCEVRIRALVKKNSLGEALRQIVSTLAKLDYPKAMVFVEEWQTLRDSRRVGIAQPTSSSLLEEGLLEWSFDVVDRNASEELRKDGLAMYAKLLGDDAEVAKVASKYGSEIAIVGSTEVNHTAYNEFGKHMHFVIANADHSRNLVLNSSCPR